MPYREPGVYLQVQNTPRGVNAGGTSMIPLIIGSGAKKLRKTASIQRALSGDTDILPATSVLSISHIGLSQLGANDWVPIVDYTFTPGTNQIAWVAGHGPSPGTTYYVTIIFDVDNLQYEPQLLSSTADVVSFYGPDVQENETGTPICPISLGAQIALQQGAPAVWCLQVKYTGTNPTAADYQLALDNYAKFIDGVWRIVPMNSGDDISAVCLGHVNLMSTIEERLERVAIYGKSYTTTDTAPTTFSGSDGVLTKIGNFATSLSNSRVSVFYPDVASKTLSNGVTYDLAANYIAAAFAGAEAVLPTYQSRTKMTLGGFTQLKGVKMTRAQKNQLAEKGVIILEQLTSGSPISVRHGLTTDMSNIQTKEIAIIAIQDFSAKSLRSACEQYIGRYSITPETINMITATVKSALNVLANSKVIIRGQPDVVMQDEDNPDTVILSVSVLPPYPCNYISITLVLE